MKIAGQTETNVQYDTRSHHLPPKNQKQLTSILVLSNFSCFFFIYFPLVPEYYNSYEAEIF